MYVCIIHTAMTGTKIEIYGNTRCASGNKGVLGNVPLEIN